MLKSPQPGISKARKPETFHENKKIAKEGGTVAKNAKLDIEKRIGKKVVSPINAKKKEYLEIQSADYNNTTKAAMAETKDLAKQHKDILNKKENN